MPPPSQSAALHLLVLPNPFFVVQFEASGGIPSSLLEDLAAGKSGFLSKTRSDDEVSVVGEVYDGVLEKCREHATWTCIKIRGPMEHGRQIR